MTPFALAAASLGCTPRKLGGDLDAGSPGTVTLELFAPADRSFCDGFDTCTGDTAVHISVLTLDGSTIGDPIGECTPECGTACNTSCPVEKIPACIGYQTGAAFMHASLQWDGGYDVNGTCGGHGSACFMHRYVAPGRYLARMCATPGTLVPGDGGVPIRPLPGGDTTFVGDAGTDGDASAATDADAASDAGGPVVCMAAGAQECVDIPFDFPGSTPVVGLLQSAPHPASGM